VIDMRLKGALTLVFFLFWNSYGFAQNKIQSVTNISFGSYQESHGADQVNGTMLSIGYQHFFTEQWAYFVKLGNGSATGEYVSTDGSLVGLESSRTSLSGGILWRLLFDANPNLIPYIGAGMSIQRYAYDFDHVDSEIGATSGTGYGPVLMTGARIEISKRVTIIPGYQYEQIIIKSESGEQQALISSGLLLALVMRF
jgi:opacity protein-like surface antigen